jgi:hypothetical protein
MGEGYENEGWFGPGDLSDMGCRGKVVITLKRGLCMGDVAAESSG